MSTEEDVKVAEARVEESENIAADKVSNNAKFIVIAGLVVVASVGLSFIFFPQAIAENVALVTVSGILGFLAGAADKLWGK